MSEIAAKGGWFKLPNTVVENLWTLTRAETALLLIIQRRRNDADAKKHGGCLVSDANWTKWTRLESRQKEYAIKGLSEKGLAVEGKGDKARYRFDDAAFRAFVRAFSPEQKVRTVGRSKAVPAPAGLLVHPDCRSNGCQMLCGGDKKPSACIELPNPAGAAELPVLPPSIGDPVPGGNGVFTDSNKRKKNIPAGTAATVADGSFGVTAEMLRAMYPTAGRKFLASLIAACKPIGTFSDAELAAAVDMAWRAKRGVQKSEGLFLQTVPPMVGAIIARRNDEELRERRANEQLEQRERETAANVARWCSLLSDFRVSLNGVEHRADFSDLAAELKAGSSSADYEARYRLFESIETRTIQRAAQFLAASDPKYWKHVFNDHKQAMLKTSPGWRPDDGTLHRRIVFELAHLSGLG